MSMSSSNLHGFNIKWVNPIGLLGKPSPDSAIPFSTIIMLWPHRNLIPVHFTSINPPWLTAPTTAASTQQQPCADLFNPIFPHFPTNNNNPTQNQKPTSQNWISFWKNGTLSAGFDDSWDKSSSFSSSYCKTLENHRSVKLRARVVFLLKHSNPRASLAKDMGHNH